MATDTVPAAVPMPPDPPHGAPAAANSTDTPSKGLLASIVAAVEPARPTTFDLNPTTPAAAAGDGDGVVDRSTPGLTSESFRDAEDTAARDASGAKRKAQGSVWKAWLLAGAQRWGKGGGTANKRLDMKKARAQANQLKESRTTTVSNSSGLPVRGPAGAGGGSKGNSSKAGPGHLKKGPVNSPGNGSGGAGRGGAGGTRGSHGPAAAKQHGGPVGTKQPGGAGTKPSGNSGTKQPKTPAAKGTQKPSASGTSGPSGAGKPGSAGKNGAAGKDGTPGTQPGGSKSGKDGKASKHNQTKNKNTRQPDTRTPLEKSRETGHKDGSNVRNIVDHVKAYTDGARDGYRDKKDTNAKEHQRLDKAHDTAKTPKPSAAGQGPDDAPLTATVNGRKVTITDDDAPMEDPFMSQPTPIQAKGIDADKITLGDGFLKPSVSRGELRRFKDYEGRLESRIDGLTRVADATKALAAQAEQQATECTQLAEQAKGVKGGEKLVGTLTKLAEQAAAQAHQAAEVHKQAVKAHDFAKAVLSNIQTRYTPLYQAVVDSDEVKPAELKFYADRGITPTALAA